MLVHKQVNAFYILSKIALDALISELRVTFVLMDAL